MLCSIAAGSGTCGELRSAESDYVSASESVARSTDENAKALIPAIANGLGQLRLQRGELDAASRDLNRSVSALTPQSFATPGAGGLMAMNNLGFVKRDAGDRAAAERHWKQGLRAAKRLENANFEGLFSCNLAGLYDDGGDKHRAIQYYQRAVAVYTNRPGSNLELGTIDNNLAILYAGVGDHDQALRYFAQAWARIREIAPRSAVAFSALDGIATSHLERGDVPQARAVARRAIELYESIRPEVAAHEAGHTRLLRAYRHSLEISMRLALIDKWDDELLDRIDRAKARFGREYMALHPARPAIPELSGPHVPLGPNVLVLNYFVGFSTTYLSYQFNSRLASTVVSIRETEMTRLVRSFRDDLLSSARQPGAGDAARRLSRVLLGDVVIGRNPLSHVHIMPDGPLWLLPFEALPVRLQFDDGDMSVRFGAIAPSSYSSSRSMLAAVRARRAVVDFEMPRLLAIGQPDDGGGGATLYGVARELQSLKALSSSDFEVDCLEGQHATKAQFLSLLPKYTHVHIASHAVAYADRADGYIVFAGPGDDRHLTPDDILKSGLRAQLVFLSACSTAFGKSSEGEGLMSVARAFLWAGCQCVVATLWPVDDTGAATFVDHFYVGFLAGASVAQAVRSAREHCDRLGIGARTWAAFHVLGDGEAMLSSHQAP